MASAAVLEPAVITFSFGDAVAIPRLTLLGCLIPCQQAVGQVFRQNEVGRVAGVLHTMPVKEIAKLTFEVNGIHRLSRAHFLIMSHGIL